MLPPSREQLFISQLFVARCILDFIGETATESLFAGEIQEEAQAIAWNVEKLHRLMHNRLLKSEGREEESGDES